MGVDETRQHDAVGGIDHRGGGAGHRDVRANLVDLAVLDQHVSLGEVADLTVEREHDATLEQDTPRRQEPRQLGVTLRLRGAAEGGQARAERCEARARLQEMAPRGGGYRHGIAARICVNPITHDRPRCLAHGLPISMAAIPAMIGSGIETRARSQTTRGGIIWISQLISRWIV